MTLNVSLDWNLASPEQDLEAHTEKLTRRTLSQISMKDESVVFRILQEIPGARTTVQSHPRAADFEPRFPTQFLL